MLWEIFLDKNKPSWSQVKVNNGNTKKMREIRTNFTHCSDIPIADFEQKNDGLPTTDHNKHCKNVTAKSI